MLNNDSQSRSLFSLVPIQTKLLSFGLDLDSPACGDASVRLKPNVKFFGTDPYERRVTEAVMVQALGSRRREICTPCSNGRSPHNTCNTLEGFFEGVCGNCKHRGRSIECDFNEDLIAQQKVTERIEKKNVEFEDSTSKR